MGTIRRHFDSEFKAKVALAALREDKTLAELSSRFGVGGNQISQWKQMAMKALPEIFSSKRSNGRSPDQELLIGDLYKKIGELEVEKDWLKKKLSF